MDFSNIELKETSSAQHILFEMLLDTIDAQHSSITQDLLYLLSPDDDPLPGCIGIDVPQYVKTIETFYTFIFYNTKALNLFNQIKQVNVRKYKSFHVENIYVPFYIWKKDNSVDDEIYQFRSLCDAILNTKIRIDGSRYSALDTVHIMLTFFQDPANFKHIDVFIDRICYMIKENPVYGSINTHITPKLIENSTRGYVQLQKYMDGFKLCNINELHYQLKFLRQWIFQI